MPKPEIIGDKDLYEIHNEIGHGAFATVYKGRRLANNQIVAIKKIKSLTKTQAQMVSKEIEIMDGLRHKNIVEYITNFRHRGQWYIILEYCGKGDLEQYKKKVGKIPQYHCKLFVKCVMEALIFMHNKNIAHRDLKLSNILITDDYQLKLADFGFSKDLEEGFFTSFCGTPLSMAPEILRREKYSPKCDVWSLGVLTYMMLFNRPPFFPTRSEGVGLQGIINAVLNRPHRYDEKVKITPNGRHFIDLCLQKDPSKRVSILTLQQHPWFHEGVDLNRSSEDRQQAFQNSLQNERQNAHTLCKLMLFGVFEQHLKKIVQTMQVSEQKIAAILKTIDEHYPHQPIREYYCLMITEKLQQLHSRQLVVVIENCSSYHIKLNKINRFNQYLAETTTLLHRSMQQIEHKTLRPLNLSNKITAFILNEVDLLFDNAQQTTVAEKTTLIRNLCELVIKDYGLSKISVQWSGNNEYEQYYTYIAEYLSKLNEDTITNLINEQLTNDNDLEAIWLIENELQSVESVGNSPELSKTVCELLDLRPNLGTDNNFETETIELLEYRKQIGLR